MKTKLSKKLVYLASIIAGGTVLGVSLQFAKAWVEPTVAPPGANVGAPINISENGQSKEGGLVVHNSSTFSNPAQPNALLVPNGRVGIGTATPSEKLDVDGNIHMSDHTYIKWGGGATAIYGENPSMLMHFLTSSTVRMAINAAGKVGIGVTDPGLGITKDPSKLLLDVKGNMRLSDREEGSSGGGHGTIFFGGDKTWIVGSNPDYRLHFGTNDTDRMTIAYDGNVGIGTTDPMNPLHIVSSNNNHALAVETSSGEAEMVLADRANGQYWEMGASSVGYHIGDLGHNMYTLVIKGDGTGRVGIGTGNPTAKLEVAGTAGVDGIKFPDGTLQTTAATGGNFGGEFQMGESDQGYDSADMSTMSDPNFPGSWLALGKHCENVNPKTGKCNCPSGYTEGVEGFIAENPGVCASNKCWDENHYCYK